MGAVGLGQFDMRNAMTGRPSASDLGGLPSVSRCDRDAREDWPQSCSNVRGCLRELQNVGALIHGVALDYGNTQALDLGGLERGSASRRGEREIGDDEVNSVAFTIAEASL
jgi:hypothetical protein